MIPSYLNKNHPEQISREALEKLHEIVDEYTAQTENLRKDCIRIVFGAEKYTV